MVDLSRRSTVLELMETEPVDFAQMQGCFADLQKVNTLTLAYRPTLQWLGRTTRRLRLRRASVLDVASGRGDMLRKLRRWSQARGLALELTGADIDPLARQSAEAATPPGMAIRYLTADVFALPPEPRYDFIVSSLFTHHLTNEQLVRFLRWMEERAARGWFINDLHRHWLAYHFARISFALAGFHRFVRHDGPLSVARAFRRDDWDRLLAEAGFAPGAVQVKWYAPFRWGVGRIK